MEKITIFFYYIQFSCYFPSLDKNAERRMSSIISATGVGEGLGWFCCYSVPREDHEDILIGVHGEREKHGGSDRGLKWLPDEMLTVYALIMRSVLGDTGGDLETSFCGSLPPYKGLRTSLILCSHFFLSHLRQHQQPDTSSSCEAEEPVPLRMFFLWPMKLVLNCSR